MVRASTVRYLFVRAHTIFKYPDVEIISFIFSFRSNNFCPHKFCLLALIHCSNCILLSTSFSLKSHEEHHQSYTFIFTYPCPKTSSGQQACDTRESVEIPDRFVRGTPKYEGSMAHLFWFFDDNVAPLSSMSRRSQPTKGGQIFDRQDGLLLRSGVPCQCGGDCLLVFKLQRK
jgi:hypothetical protein